MIEMVKSKGLLFLVLILSISLGTVSYNKASIEKELKKTQQELQKAQNDNALLATTLKTNSALYATSLSSMRSNIQKERRLCQERLERDSERATWVKEASHVKAGLGEVVDKTTEIKFQENINKTRDRWNQGE